jgi:precorrin-2 dehydrogenase/sirohydrochlorin ferrochelatase
MKYYPVYLDLRGRVCVVVGGGRVAERKAIALLDAGAEPVIVSPVLSTALTTLAGSGRVSLRKKHFEASDIRGAFLAVAATDDAATNEAVARACRSAGVLVNVADAPDAGTFIAPSVVSRGDLLIAVSTCGASPALARKVRKDLERAYGPEYGLFLERMAELRRRLLAGVTDEKVRRKVFQSVVDSDALALLKAGKTQEADRLIEGILQDILGKA